MPGSYLRFTCLGPPGCDNIAREIEREKRSFSFVYQHLACQKIDSITSYTSAVKRKILRRVQYSILATYYRLNCRHHFCRAWRPHCGANTKCFPVVLKMCYTKYNVVAIKSDTHGIRSIPLFAFPCLFIWPESTSNLANQEESITCTMSKIRLLDIHLQSCFFQLYVCRTRLDEFYLSG